MEVRSEYKAQTHVITMTWGASKLKLMLTYDGMAMSHVNVPIGVLSVLRRAEAKAKEGGEFAAFAARVREAASSCDELTAFLSRVERGS